MKRASERFYTKRPDSPKPLLPHRNAAVDRESSENTPAREVELERKLIELSGAFDPWFYVTQSGSDAQADPVDHYLKQGWHVGLEPNANFPGALMRPYFESLGFFEPPLMTWLTLRSAGWSVPATKTELEESAASIRKTDFFDEQFYKAQVGHAADGLDGAIHYALIGEPLGLAASEAFDTGYYRERYPDVAQAMMSGLRHYADHGHSEGRSARPVGAVRLGRAVFDPKKANVVLAVHETSRTGAPILGWNIALDLAARYNLHTIHLGGGELTSEFEELSTHLIGPFSWADRNEANLGRALLGLLASRTFVYAVINSAESRVVAELLARRHIPTLMLVHEFGAYVHPVATFRTALDWTTEIVFPARIVADAAAAVHPFVSMRQRHILPQGASRLPGCEESALKAPNPVLAELTRKHDEDGLFIVLGAGFVHIRKGLEYFIAAAAAMVRASPRRRIHFLWVGHGYAPEEDMAYSMYLREQVNRSHVSEHLTFLNAVLDLDAVYRIADAFFLSSRLDPLPNVSIDAARLGIPLVCFADASGTAELLLTNPDTARGVVNHLDAEAAAKFIVEMAEDKELHSRMREATRDFARERFDMPAYIAELDRLGREAGSKTRQLARDSDTLMEDAAFDQDMFLGTSDVVESRQHTIARYLALGAARTWKPIVMADTTLRRPSAGFNPRIFAASYPETLLGYPDPLAEYIRRGKPAGPWQAQVLRAEDEGAHVQSSRRLRVALHAHLFYPDLALDLLANLSPNKTRCDLWVTTNEQRKAVQLEELLGRYDGGNVNIRVVPNRGRNFGPLLTVLPEELSGYDLIGHVHGKRSVGKLGWNKGDEWRHFIWQNLLGGSYCMLDRIAAAFELQEDLGLVFPSDPHLVGWDGNRAVAGALAARLGWTGELPESFDFPLGSMFWARRTALNPLLNSGFRWEDYPEEPAPHDGTVLHALERLIPTVCCSMSGFQYAVTHVFGVSWGS